MSIRLPGQVILDQTVVDPSGAASTLGGYAFPFRIPQDTDNVVVKFAPSVTGGGMSAIFQTSDDGGTTYYDVSRTSIASSSAPGVGPQWLTIPTIGSENRNVVTTSLIATASTVAVISNGTAGASTLGSGQNSGLPLLGLQNRVFLIMTGNATAQSSRVQVIVNQQSATTS